MLKKIKLGVVMDPISKINFEKDGTFAILIEAQKKEWSLHYMEPHNLFLKDNVVMAQMRPIKLHYDPAHWFDLGEEITAPLHELDVMLMRKDPPFDMDFIYITYLLEKAEQDGLLVLNKPQSLRDANEKMFTSWFPQCCPKTLVTKNPALLRQFVNELKDIVVKPLDSMGGTSVFRLQEGDVNVGGLIDLMTAQGQHFVMAQKFIPEIFTHGDKRVFLVNGEAMPYALVRLPAQDDFRGNIVAGAQGLPGELTPRDRWICEQVGPVAKAKGLMFVGLDIIGDYLTEINVTSPTGIRQIKTFFDFNIAEKFIDNVAAELKQRHG